MPYWFGEVAHSLDDCFEEADGSVRVDDNYEPFKDGALRMDRFTGMTIPRGASILDARYAPYLASYSEDKADFRIYGELAANSARPSALETDYEISNRTFTESYHEYINADYSDGVAGLFHWVVTDVIQEIVNQSGWESGNALSLIMADNGTSRTRFNSYDIGKPARLYVLYEVPGTSLCRWVSNGLDDGRQAGAGTAHDNIGIYLSGSNAYGFIRFIDIDIPAGATIESCFLQLYVPGADGAANITISVEDSADAERLGSAEQFVSTRDFGTVTKAWSASCPPLSWNDTGNLKDLLQHLVDLPGWASGNAVAFLLYDEPADKALSVSAYEHLWARQDEHWEAAKLHVTYSAVAGRYKKRGIASGLIGGLRQGTG